MKLTVGKRIALFVHSLLSILICVAAALQLLAPAFAARCVSAVKGAVGDRGADIICYGLLAICIVLAIVQLLASLNRKKQRAERGFITVDSGETGRVRIAVSAVEQMVRQSVRDIDGINEMKINIEGEDDAISITVNAAVVSGSHVPTLTRNMQRSIRQFVEVNCGVAVSTVLISIDSVANQPEKLRQRIWGRRADKGAVTAAPQPEPPVSVEETTPDEPAPEPEEPEAKSASYDFDRPYESEFAKDLAAMNEREASETPEEPRAEE